MAWSVDSGRAVLANLPERERLILPALQALQSTFGYVPDDALDVVADTLNVSRAEVYGVLTFYHDLRTAPPAANVVRLCVAEACQAQGSRELVAEVERAYGVAMGSQTDAVEVAEVFCLGDCALGPAAMVNGTLIGRCTLERIAEVVG